MDVKLPFGHHLLRSVEVVAVRVTIHNDSHTTAQKWYTVDGSLKDYNPTLEPLNVVATAMWNQLCRQHKQIQNQREAILKVERARLKRIVSVVIERNTLRYEKKQLSDRVRELEEALEKIQAATTYKKVNEIVKAVQGTAYQATPTPPQKPAPCTALLAPADIAFMQSLQQPPQTLVIDVPETFEQALRRGASAAELKAIGDDRIKQAGALAYQFAKERIEELYGQF